MGTRLDGMRNTHSVVYRAFLARLVAERKRLGLTQHDVAAALEWPQPRISKMETGERRMDVIEASRLATLYGKPLSWFIPKLR